MFSRFTFKPFRRFSTNERIPFARSAIDRSVLTIIKGFATFKSSVLLKASAKQMVASFPTTCKQTCINASACVGFIFHGIIDEPTSFSGSFNSPKPALGPLPIQRISFAIFRSERARRRSSPARAACFPTPFPTTLLMNRVMRTAHASYQRVRAYYVLDTGHDLRSAHGKLMEIRF